MAYFTPQVSGNYSSAATWGTCTPLGTISNTLTSHLTEANPGISATFTAPSTSDSAIGFVTIAAQWWASTNTKDITINLQEYDGASWVTVATHSIDDFNSTVFPYITARFDLATPYQYTTTTPNYYRWTVYSKTSGNFVRFSQAGAGVYNPYLINIDNRTGNPVDGDQLLLIASYDNPLEVTVDAGTYTVGNFGSLLANLNTNAIKVAESGIISNPNCNLRFSTTGTIDFTVKGHWMLDGGRIYYGTEGTPGSNSVTVKLHTNSGAGVYGIQLFYNGAIYIYGTQPTKGSYYSTGVGTAASPLTNVPTDWKVGDRVVIGSGTSYLDIEHKYIETKPTSTTATLSDTVGGAESALINTYDGTAYIAMTTRNFVIQSEDPVNYTANVRRIFGFHGSGPLVPSTKYVTTGVEYRRTNTTHNTALNRIRPVYFSGCSFSFTMGRPLTLAGVGGVGRAEFYDQVIEVHASSTNNLLSLLSGIRFNGAVLMNMKAYGIYLNNIAAAQVNNTIMRCQGGKSTTEAGILLANAAGNQINNLDYAGRRYAVSYNIGSSLSNEFIGGDYKGELYGMFIASNVFVNDYYENVDFHLGINNMNNTSLGSVLNLDTFDKITNNHKTIFNNGQIDTTGLDLSDTTTKTAGNFSRKISPTTVDGVTEIFRILSPVNAVASVFFSARRDSSFVGDVSFELWLPGETSPAATVTWDSGSLPAIDTWQAISLTSATTNTVPRYAEIRITAKGTVGSVYFTDVYNGTTDDTGLRTYFRARLGVLAPTVVDIPGIAEATKTAVWTNDTRTLTTSAGGATLSEIEASTILAMKADVDALNDISPAEVNAEVDQALLDYDPPTKAELDAAQSSIETEIAAQSAPTEAEIYTHFTTSSRQDTFKADVSAIPTNPLLTTDARLDNLDATISSRLATAGYTAPANADITAIKAKTDTLVNTDLTGIATSAEITALNDISPAEVKAQADQALVDYDGPTKAELDAAEANITKDTGLIPGAL